MTISLTHGVWQYLICRRQIYLCLAERGNISFAVGQTYLSSPISALLHGEEKRKNRGIWRYSPLAGRETGESMEKKTARGLAIELTVEMTRCCDKITGRSVYVNQLMRSCSSIGANISEAKYAQSRADLAHKLEIALKECHETEYWLEVLYRLDTIPHEEYRRMISRTGSIRRILISSIKTTKKNSDDTNEME